jgi:hypothetical protein
MKASEKVIAQLKQLQGDGDTEHNHIDADRILCDFLEHLGYEDVVVEYVKVDKWYA